MPPKKLQKKSLPENTTKEDQCANVKDTSSTIKTNDNENVEAKNKLLLAKYITQACENEMKYGFRCSFIHSYNRTSFYTGINRLYISNICSGTHSNTFKSFMNNVNSISEFTCEQTYEDMRHTLLQYYVHNNHIPTVKSLVKTLSKDGSSYDKKLLVFVLNKTGFIFTKLPNTNIKIIIEKPDIFANRMRYLEKISFYRKMNRNIVYVRNMKLQLEKKEYSLIMGASPKLDWTNFMLCELKTNFFLRWLSEFLIPFLPPASVVILDHEMRYVIPTMNSQKKVLIEWLQVRNIPHDTSMHRGELYSLVEKFKNNYESDMDEVYQYIKGYGHDVLRVVPDMLDLNYLQVMWQDAFRRHKMTSTREIIPNLNLYSNLQLKKIELDLIYTEERYYKEDKAMEEILDKLLTLAKYGNIPKSELDMMKSEDPSVTLDSEFIII